MSRTPGYGTVKGIKVMGKLMGKDRRHEHVTRAGDALEEELLNTVPIPVAHRIEKRASNVVIQNPPGP